MATSIDVSWITAVLLNDGWHVVLPGTFQIDDYQFTGPGPNDAPTTPQRGYHFVTIDQLSRATQYFAGPVNYLLSVRYAVPTEIVDESQE
jgi:hypothetical protein